MVLKTEKTVLMCMSLRLFVRLSVTKIGIVSKRLKISSRRIFSPPDISKVVQDIYTVYTLDNSILIYIIWNCDT